MTTRDDGIGNQKLRLARGLSAVTPTDAADDASLEKIVGRFGALAPDEAVAWVIALAREIRALHEVGGIHGGISAGCVVLRSPDLGLLLHRFAPRRPAYHAPERIETRRISTADDVYAIGVTLHLALAGRLPSREKQSLDDHALERLLEEALAPNPKERVGLGSFIAMLEGWCTPEQLALVPRLEQADGCELDQALPTLPREIGAPIERTMRSRSSESLLQKKDPVREQPSPRPKRSRTRSILIGAALIAIGVALLFGRDFIERPDASAPPAALPH